MKYKHVLAIDPSGNFIEGKGTTGWVVMNYKQKLIALGQIAAKNFTTPEKYWNAHLDLIQRNYEHYGNNLIVVIEDYRLYAERAKNQTNSQMETCRLIGLLQWFCWKLNQPYELQLASMVKSRWNDELLLRECILFKDRRGLKHTESNKPMYTMHLRDAFRHATHYIVCRNGNKTYKSKKYKGAYGNVQSRY